MSDALVQMLKTADAAHAKRVRERATAYGDQLYDTVITSSPSEWRFDGNVESPPPSKFSWSSPPPEPIKRCIAWEMEVTDHVDDVAKELLDDTSPAHVKRAFRREYLDLVRDRLAARLAGPDHFRVGHFGPYKRRGDDERNAYDMRVAFEYVV